MTFTDVLKLEKLHEDAVALAARLQIAEASELLADYWLQFQDGLITRAEAHNRIFAVYAGLKEAE